AMPGGAKGTMHWGFDSSRNKLVEAGFDNMGSTWSGTSDGPKDGTTVWTEEGTMMGQPSKTRTTVTRKSPREVTLVTEMETKPGAWQKLGEDTCKKKEGPRPVRRARTLPPWQDASMLQSPGQGQATDAPTQAALSRILEGTASEIGEGFFRALVENLAGALGTRGAWVTEFDPVRRRLRA